MKKVLLLIAGFGLMFAFVWLMLDFLFQGYLYGVWILPFAEVVCK